MDGTGKVAEPLALHAERVRPEWIDYNGHMNVAFYVLAFDHATDAFFDFVGLDETYRKTRNATTFTAEAHVVYLRELHEGDEMRFTTQLLGFDDKRLHYFHRMLEGEGGQVVATLESISLHIDLAVRRVSPFPEDIRARFAELWDTHRALPWPEQAGRVIKIPARGG